MKQAKIEQITKEIEVIKKENYMNAKMFLSLKLIKEHGDWIASFLKQSKKRV